MFVPFMDCSQMIPTRLSHFKEFEGMAMKKVVRISELLYLLYVEKEEAEWS